MFEVRVVHHSMDGFFVGDGDVCMQGRPKNKGEEIFVVHGHKRQYLHTFRKPVRQ